MSSITIDTTLAALTEAGLIAWSKVDDDRLTISLSLTYLDNSDPSCGYDNAGKATEAFINATLKDHGFTFSDAGFEDDGSGREWWAFRLAA
jgi:hypothetical protein